MNDKKMFPLRQTIKHDGLCAGDDVIILPREVPYMLGSSKLELNQNEHDFM